MAKEFTIVKSDNNGYIIKALHPEENKGTLTTHANFGQVVKQAREWFDEVVVKGKTEVAE